MTSLHSTHIKQGFFVLRTPKTTEMTKLAGVAQAKPGSTEDWDFNHLEPYTKLYADTSWTVYECLKAFFQHERSENAPTLGAKNQRKLFLHKVFRQPFGSWTPAPKIVDVRTKKRVFPAAPVVGRNSLTQGHPSVRVRNVCGKSGPNKNYVYAFFSPSQRTPRPY